MTTSTSGLRELTAEFPVLRREVDGRPLVYLDSAATSQTPQVVIDAMVDYYTNFRASVHRGVYPLVIEATDLYEGARERIAAWLGSTVEETIFTANATASINLVAHSWGRSNLKPGDVVLVTEMEHHSDVVPWQLICAERGARVVARIRVQANVLGLKRAHFSRWGAQCDSWILMLRVLNCRPCVLRPYGTAPAPHQRTSGGRCHANRTAESAVTGRP